MPRKDVYLFDNTNNPLQVQGIQVELFDAVTGQKLDSDLSKDLNPSPSGWPSNEWGVQLTFTAGTNPLDILITDPRFNYPGNTVRNLYGKQDDRIDIDLLKLPRTPGGQGSLTSTTAISLVEWIKRGERWSPEDKRAVLNLIGNYISAIVPHLDRLPTLSGLQAVAHNWEQALSGIGIDPDLLRK